MHPKFCAFDYKRESKATQVILMQEGDLEATKQVVAIAFEVGQSQVRSVCRSWPARSVVPSMLPNMRF